MKLLLVLLAILGSTLSMKVGHEYVYHYNGRIGMGIPEIKNNIAGLGLQSRVRVQIQSAGHAIVQLEDLKLGEYFGKDGCELMAPMPLRWSPVSGYAKTLEEPFVVNYLNDVGDVMVVPKTDIEWVVNLRKSIALLFVVEPIRENYLRRGERSPVAMIDNRSDEFSSPAVFTVTEPTIFGHCQCDYVFIPIEHQSSRSSDSQHYQMTRTIDFDHCKQRVELQHFGISNGTNTNKNLFGDIVTRSSVWNYTLEYTEGNFVAKDGFIIGHEIAHPFGMKSDKMVSITNTTFHLESDKQIDQPIIIKYTSKRNVKTWLMEVYSPYSAPSDSVEWINFHSDAKSRYAPLLPETVVTGIPLSEQDISEYRKVLDTTICSIEEKLRLSAHEPTDKPTVWDTLEAEILSLLDMSKKVIRGIDVQNLESLFHQYNSSNSQESERKLSLLIDIAASSGAAAPTKMLLDALRVKKISNERGATIFITMPNHFIATPVVPDLISYMKTLDITKEPFYTSTVYVSIAATLKRVCIGPSSSKYATPYMIYGSEHCNGEEVVNSVVHYWENKLEDVQENWQKSVIIKAISNIGSLQSFSVLQRVLYNANASPDVKRAAMYGLVRPNLPLSMKNRVFQLLMPFIENQSEETALRQTALIILLSWRPSASWWHRLSVMSWRERSMNMGSFIYMIMKNNEKITDPLFTREARVARFLVPFTKAYSPSSQYSFVSTYAQHDIRDFTNTDFIYAFVMTEGRTTPIETASMISNSFGGLRLLLGELSVSHPIQPESREKVLKTLERFIPENFRSNVRSSANRQGSSLLEELLDTSSVPTEAMTLYLQMFDNLQMLLPINAHSISTAFGENGAKIIDSWTKGTNIELIKYFDATPIEQFRPTEVGLPLITMVSSPIFQSMIGQTQLKVPGTPNPTIFDVLHLKNIEIQFKPDYKLATKTIVSFSAPSPWNQKLISTGVDILKNLNVPADITVAFRDIQEGNMKNVSVRIEPLETKQFPVIYLHTIPHILQKSMWPKQHWNEFFNYQTLSVNEGSSGVNQVEIPFSQDYSGLRGSMRYYGDVSYPYTYGNLIEHLRSPQQFSRLLLSPTVRTQRVIVDLEMAKSETKAFSGSIAFTVPYSHQVRSFYTNTLQANVTALFESSKPRYYEAGVRFHENNDNPEKTSSVFDFHWSRLPVPNVDKNTAGYCLRVDAELPKIQDFRSLSKVLQNNEAHIKYTGSLNGGKNCQDQNIGSMTGEMVLSSNRSQKLYKELENDCNFDMLDPMANFRTIPVYDELHFEVQYKEPLPSVVRNSSYHLYDIVRGFAYPHIYFNYLDIKNPSGKMNLHGHRSINSGVWDFQAKLPTENVVLDNFKLAPIFDEILPVGGLRGAVSKDTSSVSSRMVLNAQLSDTCILDSSMVRTFDGLKYRYNPKEGCAAVTVAERKNPQGPSLRMFRNENHNEFEAAVKMSSPLQLTLEFSARSLTVNRDTIHVTTEKQVIKDSRGNFFATARRVGKYMEVSVPGNFSVRLSDQEIEVVPAPQMRNKLSGLCGDYNGETKNELVGPESCLYENPILYQMAWIEKYGPSCSSGHFEKCEKMVHEYRKNCPKSVDGADSAQSWKVDAKRSEDSAALQYIYPIRKRGGNVCVSQVAVGMCLPNSPVRHYTTDQVVFDCWSESKCPEYLAMHLDRGFVMSQVSTPIPVATTATYEVTNAKKCSPRN